MVQLCRLSMTTVRLDPDSETSCERTLIRLNDRSRLVDLLREILLRHGRFFSEAGGRDGFGHGNVYRIWWCDFVFCSLDNPYQSQS